MRFSWVVAPLLLAVAGGCGSVKSADPDAAVDNGDDDAASPPDAALPTNIVFVTSTTHTGQLGGLSGADEVCTTRAEQAGLPGTYVAWLSTENIDAVGRLGSARGWVRPDGKPFVDTIEELLVGAIRFPARLDETGTDQLEATVWTATTEAGEFRSAATSCDSWTIGDADPAAGIGAADAGTRRWTQADTSSCSEAHRLLCFGTDHDNPVQIEPAAGRLAFLSPNQITSTTGVGGFDSLCQTAAEDAGEAGTFSAALVTVVGTTAASRFDLGGDTWVRPDGIPIVADAAALATGPLDAPISQRIDGSYLDVNVFVGGTSLGADGIRNCADWTDPDGSVTVLRSSQTVETNTGNCGRDGDPISQFVFCLQQ
jgi:hypothetical protein